MSECRALGPSASWGTRSSSTRLLKHAMGTNVTGNHCYTRVVGAVDPPGCTRACSEEPTLATLHAYSADLHLSGIGDWR